MKLSERMIQWLESRNRGDQVRAALAKFHGALIQESRDLFESTPEAKELAESHLIVLGVIQQLMLDLQAKRPLSTSGLKMVGEMFATYPTLLPNIGDTITDSPEQQEHFNVLIVRAKVEATR